MPLDDYRFTCMIDYNSPVLARPLAGVSRFSASTKETAPCGPFCFRQEWEWQLTHTLRRGADLTNAVLMCVRAATSEELEHLAKLFNRNEMKVAPQGILNNMELRYQNEPARHKLLDMIGDLALVGVHLKGHIMAARPGHAANVAFAKKIKAAIKKEKNKKI